MKKAQDLVSDFHKKLCETTVLDPACGSGNFLYLALDLFKRLESEVLALLHDLGVRQLDLAAQTVTPSQFKGIEVRRQSKEIAELVLWIGYLQWHHRMYGSTKNPPEPILRDYKNIECRDALVTRLHGLNELHQSSWPGADFIVGNPPFIGNKRMRDALGDEYVDGLRQLYPADLESADLVMYWWERAAEQVIAKKSRVGLITTNSIAQTYNRRVVERRLNAGVAIHFAVPDHPWVDSSSGAAVRIAMTVLSPQATTGTLARVVEESGDSENVVLSMTSGTISADLHQGPNVLDAVPLKANTGLSFMGVTLGNKGFVLRPGDPLWESPSAVPMVIGRDLNQTVAAKKVIDFSGLDEREAVARDPQAFQRVLERVKPERDVQRRESYRTKWWQFVESRSSMRRAVESLPRCIVTCRTATHRVFSFLEKGVVPESTVVVVASSASHVLGILSSRAHAMWAHRSGTRLGMGNDPRYNNSICFETFPFPTCSDESLAAIGNIADSIDEHRRQRMTMFPNLTITEMYNVIEKGRVGAPLSPKEQVAHEQGLLAILQRLHDQLDETVLLAYGWPLRISDENLLEGLLNLNAQRAAEEASGLVQWVRPDYQVTLNAQKRKKSVREEERESKQLTIDWPKTLPEQVSLVRTIVNGSTRGFSAADVAGICIGASSEDVLPVLESLEALGLTVSYRDDDKRWVSVTRIVNDRSSGPGLRKVSSRPPPPVSKSA